jgi:hypothetical protein
MRRFFAGLAAAAFVATMAAPAFAKEMTVKGEVIDQTCYMKDHAKIGADHRECGQTCAKKGAPMALLTSDGKVYQITGGLAADKNAKLVPHISHMVEITGDVTESDGKMMIAADSLTMSK